MKVIPITLTLMQLKELCEKRMTELSFKNGTTIVRITVTLDFADNPC